MIVDKNVDIERKKIRKIVMPYFKKELEKFMFEQQSKQNWIDITRLSNKFLIKCQYDGLFKNYKVTCNGKNNSLNSSELNLKIIISGNLSKYEYNFKILNSDIVFEDK